MPRKSTVIQKITRTVNNSLDAVGDGLQGWEGPDPVFVEDLAVFKLAKGKKKEKPKITL